MSFSQPELLEVGQVGVPVLQVSMCLSTSCLFVIIRNPFLIFYFIFTTFALGGGRKCSPLFRERTATLSSDVVFKAPLTFIIFFFRLSGFEQIVFKLAKNSLQKLQAAVMRYSSM